MVVKKIFILIVVFIISSFLKAQNDETENGVYSDTFGFEEDYTVATMEESDSNILLIPAINERKFAGILRDLSKNKMNKIRAGVAANPYTPEKTLVNLLKDKSIVVRVEAAMNPNIPLKYLEDILQERDSIMEVAIASNPKSSLNILTSILLLKNPQATFKVYSNPSFPAKYLENNIRTNKIDPNIMSTVASNASLSPETLLELSTIDNERYLPVVLSNPTAPIGTIITNGVNPFEEKNNYLVQSLLVNPNLSDNLKIELIDYLAYDIIFAQKAKDPNLSLEEMTILSQSTNPILRKNIAANISAPIDLLRKLAKDENEQVRINVAKNSSNSIGLLKEMMTDSSEDVKMAIAMNKIATDDILFELFNSIVDNLIINKEIRDVLPDELTLDLINNSNPEVRYSLALCDNVSPAVLNLLSEDQNNMIREAVAVNKNTPIEALEILALDTEINVRNGVVLNPNATPQILSDIVVNPNNDEYILADFLFNPNTSDQLFQTISESVTVRELAENKWKNSVLAKTPESVSLRLQTLFPDTQPKRNISDLKGPEFILSMLENPDIPKLSISTILYSLSDLSFSVTAFNEFQRYFYLRTTDKLISPEGVGKQLLEKMKQDKLYLDKLIVAHSSASEYDILVDLFENGDQWIKLLVASNPSIGAQYFKYLVDTTKDEFVQSGLAQNPLMSADDLEVFLKKFKSTTAKTGVACKGITL